jgi:hypothetical protein
VRRILTGVLASAFLALALPAAASAHHRARHDARGARAHHHHRRHHRTVVFAPSATPSNTTTTPTTPTTEEPVATVASFEGGVLKITLPDGSTVSGKVTEETWIGCGCDHSGSQGFQHEGWQGDQNDQGDDGPGDFQHDDMQGTETESCGVSALVPGAKIKDAELNVSGEGAVWEKVELLPKS